MFRNLPDDVKAELEDPEYATRKHYSRATYALGCHGPLCRKAERDRGRGRNERRARDAGREYRPILGLRVRDDETMEQIVAWYLDSYEQRMGAAS